MEKRHSISVIGMKDFAGYPLQSEIMATLGIELIDEMGTGEGRSWPHFFCAPSGELFLVVSKNLSYALDWQREIANLEAYAVGRSRASVQPFLKALRKLNSHPPTLIVDGHAGLAIDALEMVLCGMNVLCCEENIFLQVLLYDAFRRQWPSICRARTALRDCQLTFFYGDFLNLNLERLAAYRCGDVPYVPYKSISVYLDPMFEGASSRKKRLPKKGMQVIRALASRGDASRDEMCLQHARMLGQRVLVKRPANGCEVAANLSPIASYRGRLVRYDLYYS